MSRKCPLFFPGSLPGFAVDTFVPRGFDCGPASRQPLPTNQPRDDAPRRVVEAPPPSLGGARAATGRRWRGRNWRHCCRALEVEGGSGCSSCMSHGALGEGEGAHTDQPHIDQPLFINRGVLFPDFGECSSLFGGEPPE